MTEMDVKTTSDYTRLSLRTIYNLVSTGRIPFKRISAKKVVFVKEEIDEWLSTRVDGRRTRRSAEKEATIALPEESAVACSHEVAAPNRTAWKRFPLLSFGMIAVTLLLLGWGGGYLFFKSKARGSSISNPKPLNSQISVDMGTLLAHAKIDSLDLGQVSDESDHVQVKLDYLSQIVNLEGAISSPQIKPFLVNTLKSTEDSYAIKSKTLDALKSHFLDPEVKDALIHAMTHDTNPLIRMKAMTVLANIASSEDVNKALVDRLKNDETTGIRFRALELIEDSMGKEILNVLKSLKEKDENSLITKRINLIFRKYGNASLQKKTA
jgi:excisionase family DNA binding protein